LAKKIPENEEKLHLLVEGKNSSDVSGAVKEIQRILNEESSLMVAKNEKHIYSKFSVL